MNEEKFTGIANLYSKFRPTYPMELIDWLFEKTHAETVADIGAGTGIFTKCLTVKSWNITAVEPNDDMRSKLDIAGVEVVKGTAENTNLQNNSVELITAAQAFHWFDGDGFKKECGRILKPTGSVAIIYNERRGAEFLEERNAVFKEYCGIAHVDHLATESVKAGEEELKKGFFSQIETFVIENNRKMDLGSYIGRELSCSYALKENHERFAEFKEALTGLFEKYQKDGLVDVEIISVCYLGKI